MEVFRISAAHYAGALMASGKAARWNKDQQFVLYTGESRSLSTLELVVHKNGILSSLRYEVMVISIADEEDLYRRVPISALPPRWREHTSYQLLQDIGSNWYASRASLVLQVPSAIIPQEFNYIINLNHPDFSRAVTHVRNENYFWDQRLL